MKNLKLILCYSLLLLNTTLFAQVNIVTNPQLEVSDCGDNDLFCPHFSDCLEGWTITHGTPNYVASSCMENPEDKDHHVQLICKHKRSEGIMTSVSLNVGHYRLFVRTKVQSVPANVEASLQVTLDQDLIPIPEGDLSCQDSVPSTDNTRVLFDAPLDDDGKWHWVIVDLDIAGNETLLNQLMLTGLVNTARKQAIIHVDCIYLYRICYDPLVFSSRFENPIIIDDGVYASCSYIHNDAPFANGSAVVPPGAQVDLIANDYVLLVPSFHAQSTFCARIMDVMGDFDQNFRPPCHGCLGDEGNLNNPPQSDHRTSEGTPANARAEQVIIYPNPAETSFNLSLPEGTWEIYIYNMEGKQIEYLQSQESIFVDTHEWAKGNYLLKIVNTNTLEQSTSKIMIH